MSALRKAVEPGILIPAILALLLIALTPLAAHWLREPVAGRTEGLPLSFPHSKHTHTGCPVCHHNLKEKSAGLPCIHCHKGNDPDLKRGIEGEFHDFCMGCHAAEARHLAKHGPVSECEGCHKQTADGYLP